MLDLRECTYQSYGIEIDRLAPGTRRIVKDAYQQIDDYILATALLIYVAYSPDARKKSFDLDGVIRRISLQMNRLPKEIDKRKLVVAQVLLEKFNKMNSEYVRYKRAHPEKSLPYVEFLPCVFYVDALELAVSFDQEDYPHIKCWQEFFMIIPQTLEPDEKYPPIRLWEYHALVQKGRLDEWYLQEKGYGVRLSPLSPANFKELYQKELQDMSDDELAAEYRKFNWGHMLVRQEMDKRGVAL